MPRLSLLLIVLSLSAAGAERLEHRVQAGDTAYSLARRYGLSVDQLLLLNGLSTPDLRIGQLLAVAASAVTTPANTVPAVAVQPAEPAQVPAAPAAVPVTAAPDVASSHTVVAGDTLYSISRRHGTTVQALQALNGLTSAELRVGQVLTLPSPGAAPHPTPPQAAPPAAGLRDLALAYLNVPYLLGGNSQRGLDCSGLVLLVYTPLGVNLPRRSEEQFHSGVPVDAAELREGDLVFFDTEGAGKVSHVGIVLGPDEFVHASTYEGRVTVSRLSEKYYAQRYLGARRVLEPQASAH